MTNLSSVLLIDDETDFQVAFIEALKIEAKKNLFQLQLASSGKQGLTIIKNNNQKKIKTFAFIDIILPDIMGNELIDQIDQEKINIEGVLISAHKSDHELEQIRNQYNWIKDSISKPLNKKTLKNAIRLFINDSSISGFNYSTLNPETAKFLLQETREIKILVKQTTQGIIEIGERLQKVKNKLEHGKFKIWLEHEIQCHYTTALNFMRVSATFGQQKEEITRIGITPSVLYLLSAPSTPEYLITEIIERAKVGNPASFAETKRLKKEYTKKKNKRNLAPEANSATEIADNSSSLRKVNNKQQIISVISQNKSWNLDRHFLYYGSPQDSKFRERLPAKISLNIGFPDSRSWSKESIFPVEALSTFVFYSVFQNLDSSILTNNVQKIIETYTDNQETILFSGLPNPKMLLIADQLNCQCFIANSCLGQCQDIVTLWEITHSKK